MGGRRPPLTRPLAALAVLVAGAAGSAGAQARAAVRVEAVTEVAPAVPGGGFRVAVRLQIPDGYHLGWPNPGQSGLPTTLAWRTPSDLRAGPSEWPAPELDTTAGMISHVYRGIVVVVTRFQVAPAARRGRAVLRAALSWGLCGATCLPQRDSVEADVVVAEGAPDTTAAWRALAPALETLPLRGDGLAISAAARGDRVLLRIAGPALGSPSGGRAVFFPRPGGTAVVASVARAAQAVEITLPRSVLGAHPMLLDGVLVADRPWLGGSPARGLAVATAVGYR